MKEIQSLICVRDEAQMVDLYKDIVFKEVVPEHSLCSSPDIQTLTQSIMQTN
jgi:hypothetical protein